MDAVQRIEGVTSGGLPDLILELGTKQEEIKRLQGEVDALRAQALMHFRTLGVRSSEAGPYVASHTQGERLSWSKANLTSIHGIDWAATTDEELRKHGMLIKIDTLTVRMRSEPKQEQSTSSNEKDFRGEIEAFFG